MSEYHRQEKDGIDRRAFMTSGAAASIGATAALAAAGLASNRAWAESDPYADPTEPALSPSDMKLDLKRTAVVVTDPAPYNGELAPSQASVPPEVTLNSVSATQFSPTLTMTLSVCM